MKKRFPLRFLQYPCLLLINLSVCLLFFSFFAAYAADTKKETPAKSTTTQQIGGLLFDVDEGVKVEQGPGGSVYMKSNKEFMQERLSRIDQELLDLDQRVQAVEAKLARIEFKDDPAAKNSAVPAQSNEENRRVLVT